MLKGKVAVVTGSTSGIGLGIARALAENGAHVVLNGIEQTESTESIRRGIEEQCGVSAALVIADLAAPDACVHLVQEAVTRFGTVDILVNNAGIQYVSPTQNFPVEKWDLVLAVNLSSAFHTMRSALPHMQEKGWGRIINIASTHGLVASVQKAAYIAAKHGLVGLTKVVALENAETRITCNAICPGWVRTPLLEPQIEARAKAFEGNIEEGIRSLVGEKQPSKRFSTPEDIGALAIFLCSDAAHNVTGAAFPVDGGWTAQ